MLHPLLPIRPPTRPLLLLSTATMHSSSSSAPPPPQQLPQNHPHPDQQQQQKQQTAINYHNRTKHSLTSGYARGPRGLDWAHQPNPFLRFPNPNPSPSPSTSAAQPQNRPLPLPLLPPRPHDSPHYPLLFSSSLPSPSPLSLLSLSRLLFDSLSLSAWKTTGLSTWSLRVNPSSGNLHPTEAHLLIPPLPESSPYASPAVAHYSPKDHSLEPRAFVPADSSVLASLLPPPSLLAISLSSVFWREAWKYGERALRYCNHDAGHALAAVAIAAAALGWDSRLLDGLSHADLEALIGVPQTYPPPPAQLPDRPVRGKFPWIEAQHPDCALLIFPVGTNPAVDYSSLQSVLASKFASLGWLGKPNSLSREHVCWNVIYETAEAIKKPPTNEHFSINPFRSSGLISEKLYKDFTIRELVRKRRSAVDMDRVHIMERNVFYQILLHCLPTGELGHGEGHGEESEEIKKQGKQCALPFRVLTWDAEVHAALFVHRVSGLPKGLYFLVRNEDHLDALKRAMRPEFEWERPDECPDALPLYRLARGDCQELAKQLSCHQDIASDGCFSLGMVARFEPVLREKGAWMYPRLFWETGVLGQVLYLEAHAVGISATGIGCYFDDAVHEVLGIKDLEFQSLYHFTVGGPVVDKRIMSLPAYPGPGIDT